MLMSDYTRIIRDTYHSDHKSEYRKLIDPVGSHHSIRINYQLSIDNRKMMTAIITWIFIDVQNTRFSLFLSPRPNSYEINLCEAATIAEFRKANIETMPPTTLYTP